MSVWQSADPILGRYLPTGNKDGDANLPGMGGVFNSLNLGLYTYSHQNSIRLIDPDGNAPEDTAGIRLSSPPSLSRLSTFEAFRRDTSIDQAVEADRGFREVTAPMLMAVEAGPLLLAGAVEATPVVAKVAVENAGTVAEVMGVVSALSGMPSNQPDISPDMDPKTHVEKAREVKSPKPKANIISKVISFIAAIIVAEESQPE